MYFLLFCIQIVWVIAVRIMKDNNSSFEYAHSFKWFQEIKYNRDLTTLGKWFFSSLASVLHLVVLPTTVLWYVIIHKIPSMLFKTDNGAA